MNQDNPLTYKRDPVFERLVQPLTDDDLGHMKESLLKDPDSAIIHVWQDFILFDYEKYDLCRSLDLPCIIRSHDFPGINEAASFVCSYQLARPDLTSQ